MPIKSLENLRGFPFIGDIRKGSEKRKKINSNGEEYEVFGSDLDYFRVTFRRGYEHLSPVFNAHFGDKPTTFSNVFMDGDTPDATFDYWLIERTKTKVVHKCDGEFQVQRWDTESVAYAYDNAACERTNGGKCGCVRNGVLKVMLADFFNLTGVWGVFLVHTSSFNDIANIAGYLKKQYRILGTLFQVPFVLSRVPESIIVPNNKGKSGDKMHKDSHLLRLEIDSGFTRNWAALQFTQRPYQIRDGQINYQSGEMIQIPDHTSNHVEPLLPDEEVEYDLDYANEMTSHLFAAPSHQNNALQIMLESGEITSEMSTESVIAAIKQNRANRNVARFEDGTFWDEKDLVKQFCSAVNLSTGLTAEQIRQALNADYRNEPKAQMKGFKGMNKSHAWALCLIYSARQDFDIALVKADGMPDVQEELKVMEKRLADIPF